MKLSEKIKIMLEMEEAKSPKKLPLWKRIHQANSLGAVNAKLAVLGGIALPASIYASHKVKPHIDAFASAHPKLTTTLAALTAAKAVAGLGGLAYIAHKNGWLKKKKQEQEPEKL
jgi:hypothetical protein